MDVLHATREINVLERQLKSESSDTAPESLFDAEAQRRFGSGSAATQAVKAFLAAQGVYHEDDLLELGAHDLPKLLRDTAAWTPHRFSAQQVKKLERWVQELSHQRGPPASEGMER
jgi:hypothetical protein